MGGGPQPHRGVGAGTQVLLHLHLRVRFSHYVAAGFIALTDFQLLLAGWRGYLIAWLAVVAVANLFMSLYGRLRVDIKSEGLAAKVKEQDIAIKAQIVPDPPQES